MDSKKIIKDDIMLYKKNKFASTFTLLGLVLTVLYFALLYSVNTGFFYTITMGFSVIVTLVLLLTAFLASESIKNYRKVYCIVLIVLAAINILRIFYYPLKGLQTDSFKNAVYFWKEMSSAGIFTFMVIYLVASAACYVIAAVFGYLSATRREKHEKGIANGTINVEEALKVEDELAEEAAKTEQADKAVSEAPAVEESEENVKEISVDEAEATGEDNGSSGEVE